LLYQFNWYCEFKPRYLSPRLKLLWLLVFVYLWLRDWPSLSSSGEEREREREEQHTMLFLFNRAGRESHWFDRKMSKNHEFGLSCALDAYVCVPSPKCCVTGRHASVLKHVTFLLCLSSMGFSSSSWFLLEWLVVVVVVVVRHSLLPFHRFA